MKLRSELNKIIRDRLVEVLSEVRKPDIDYNEKFVDDQLDKVVAVLEGKQGSYTTRLARKYQEVNEEYKRLKDERKDLREDVLKHAESLFDAEDEVATRIIETVGLTLQLDKPVSYEREDFDKEGFLEELMDLVPELEDKIEELIEKYTEVKQIQRSSRVRVKEEDLSDKVQKIWNKVSSALYNFWQKIRNWGENYDQKLEKVRAKYLSK